MKASRTKSMALCVLLSVAVPAANAFTVQITKGPDTLYLRVGDGVYAGTFSNGDDPPSGSFGSVNKVSVVVPAAVLGNGTSLPMASNASQMTSNWDGFAFCNPNQVYVGGFYRHDKKNGPGATLNAAVTQPLTNSTGETIPFTEISWISSGNGDTSQPFDSGAFTGVSQKIGDVPANSWDESCHSFSYRNRSVVAAGTYKGTVTYSLVAP